MISTFLYLMRFNKIKSEKKNGRKKQELSKPGFAKHEVHVYGLQNVTSLFTSRSRRRRHADVICLRICTKRRVVVPNHDLLFASIFGGLSAAQHAL